MNFLKKSIKKISNIYGETIPVVFSIAFLFLIIFALSMINNFTIYLSFALLLFLFFPLLLSSQLFLGKVFTRKSDSNYKEIYKQLKLYFSPMFKGTYSVFSAFMITLGIMFLLVIIFENIVIRLNPDFINITSQNELVEKLLALPYFNHVSLTLFGLMIFVFLYRIFSKAVNVYLALYCGIHKSHVKAYFNFLRIENKYNIKNDIRSIGLPLMLLFLLLYFITAFISYHFLLKVDLAIFIGLFVAIIGCSLYLPIYFYGCFNIAMSLKDNSPLFLQKQITREYIQFMNNPRLSEEDKNFIKEKYEKISQIFPKENNLSEEEIKEIEKKVEENFLEAERELEEENEEENKE